MIVIDASVAAFLLGDDGQFGARLRARVAGQRLFAPEILDLEVISTWRRAARAGRLQPQRAQQALRDLDDLSITRTRHRLLVPRIWELRDNLSSYDGVYVALAEALKAPLLTADARVARAPGLRCEVELFA